MNLNLLVLKKLGPSVVLVFLIMSQSEDSFVVVLIDASAYDSFFLFCSLTVDLSFFISMDSIL